MVWVAPRFIGSRSRYVPLVRKALAAEDRAALGRAKRDRSLLATLGANRLGLNARELMSVARTLRARKNGDAPRLAILATLRLILEILVAKKDLFPGGKHEFPAAIDAV
jgi:hypothetical protein